MRATISKNVCDAMKPGEMTVDDKIDGFIARCLPSGRVTFAYRYWHGPKRRYVSLGVHGKITPDQARTKAEKRRGEVASERDPLAEQQAKRAEEKVSRASTVDALLDNFVERYVRKNLRGAAEVERVFKVCVRPEIGSTSIYELRRTHVVEMLDKIEDERGPVMADRTLAYTRKAFTWYAARDDRFNSPIIRGMARTKPKERARKRMLRDDEIRQLNAALDIADVPSCYPAYIRALVLTAQRREEVAGMRWEEIEGDVWTIPANRYKTKVNHVVPLTPAIRALLGEPQKRGYVFSTTGGEKPFSGFSKARRALDKVLAGMEHWTLHDLRRTSRSLMSRAGVSGDIGERVLGHVIPGVRDTYDRHDYLTEKRDALEKLAGKIELILHPPADNVASFERKTA